MGKHRVLGGKGVVFSPVREKLLRPDLPDDFHRFLEKLPVFLVLARVGVGMKLRALVGPDTPAEADIHPAPGHVVQDGDILRQPYWVPPGCDVCHLADANPGGAGSQVGAQQNWVGKISRAVEAKMVLSQPDGFEAQFFRQDRLLPEIIQYFCSIGSFPGRCSHGGKCGKLHVVIPVSEDGCHVPIMYTVGSQ